MKKFKLFAILPLLLIVFKAQSLEVDEKLTGRILKVSSSQKTVLLNRGLEDGLVVDDHAKVFLTTGVIARGLVVKAAPTRSIWSIYRIVDPQQIRVGNVVNLKITVPVKLTEDPSRAIYEKEDPVDISSSIPLAEGANDLDREGDLSEMERGDLDSLEGSAGDGEMARSQAPEVQVRSSSGLSRDKTLEFWGLLHLNGLSSQSDLGEQEGTSSGSNSTVDFSLGVEKYFFRQEGFLKDISLRAFFHSSTKSTSTTQGAEISTGANEFGGGVNYHFLAHPLSYFRLIGFVGFNAGIGSSSDSFSVGENTEGSELDGSSNFFSLEIGAKYYTAEGFGGRFVLDYYRRGESYAVEDDGEYTKVVSGPRAMVGLSYRF